MARDGTKEEILRHGIACDAMLKGLTRWLRAAGYDVSWTYGIEDDELVRVARKESRVLMTSDSELMKAPAIVQGEVSALFLPRDLSVPKQVEFVFRRFDLARREPRCMKCGGPLAWIPKASVRDEAPPKTYCWLSDFYRCLRCGQLFWKGTHWQNIRERLDGFFNGE